MKYTVERYFNNTKLTCLGAGYTFYADLLTDLIYKMKDKIGRGFREGEYLNLTFLMNIPFYYEFCIACKMTGHDSSMYRDIRIISDPTLHTGDTQSPEGIVRLVYEKPEIKQKGYYNYNFWPTQSKIALGLSSAAPHIDHVKFNGPATIVFWKDGTKTVVKHDGKGRKDKRLAILYAFMRKIYGEGKPYHYILNEIEEAVK